MIAKFRIDSSELIQEMDLQMGMTLNYVLNRANDGSTVATGVVNDGDCIDSCVDFRKYIVSATDNNDVIKIGIIMDQL